MTRCIVVTGLQGLEHLWLVVCQVINIIQASCMAGMPREKCSAPFVLVYDVSLLRRDRSKLQ
jgi:hypothetical protein